MKLRTIGRVKLVFVYNADGRLRNGVKGLARKTLARKADTCKLTEVTITPLGMHRDWKRFVDSLDAEVEFFHRDEMPSPCAGAETDLPAVFKQCGNCLKVWITPAEINACGSLVDLKNLVQGHLCEEC